MPSIPTAPRTQYASHAFGTCCAALDLRGPVDRSGACYNNAVVETFFTTWKGDLGNGRRYARRTGPRCDVVAYI